MALMSGDGKKRIRSVLQNEAMECGLACMAMVANAYRHDIDLPYLRALFPPSRRGMTLAEIVELAGHIGLDAQGLAVTSVDELANIGCPAILHWDSNHFVVLEKVVRGSFHVHDPAFGLRIYEAADLERRFSGIALEFERRLDFQEIKEKRQSLFWAILRSCRGIESTIVSVSILSFAASLFALATPVFLQTAVDTVIPQYDLDLLNVVVAGLILFSAFEAVSRWLRDIVTLRAATLFEIHLTRNVVGHALRLPLTFFEARHAGDFITRLTSIDHIKAFLVGGFVSSIADGVMSVLVVGMMFFYSTSMAVASLVTLAVAVLIRTATFSEIARTTTQTLESRSEEQTRLLDGLAMIGSLKASNSTNFFGLKWLESFNRFANSSFRMRKLSIDSDLMLHLVFTLGTVVTLYMGVTDVMKSTISVGVLYAFFSLRGSFFASMNALILNLLQLSMMRVHFNRLDDVLDAKPEPLNERVSMDRAIRREIALDGVTIRFDTASQPLLADVNLKIAIDRAETIAIIGPSGCGKSSLLKVLASLTTAAQGRLLVDGKAVESFGLHEYRANIGCVFADDRIVTGTVTENLSLFSPDVTRADMDAALAVVGLADDIADLPQGFATLLSEESSLLSTGQRRRFVLARALCRHPRLLLLDEATANLDPASETKLLQALSAVPAAKVLVTHSAGVLPFADRVFRVEQGALVEVKPERVQVA